MCTALGAQTVNEILGIDLSAIHRSHRREPENHIIERSAVLPFCQESLPIKKAQLSVTQPDCGQVRTRTAGASGHLNTNHAVFSTIALGAFDTQLVESLEVVLIDRWYGGAFFGRLKEFAERLEKFRLLIAHRYASGRGRCLCHRLHSVTAFTV